MFGSGKDAASANINEPGALGTSDSGAAEASRQAKSGFDWEKFFKGLSGDTGSGPLTTPASTPAFSTPEGASVPALPATTLPQGRASFMLAPHQDSALAARFGTNVEAKRKYLIERILSGDRSLAPYTPEQMYAARTQAAQTPQAQQPSAFEALVSMALRGR